MRRLFLSMMISSGMLAAPHALAHRTWLLPSATVLSAPGDWVTVDAAVSNELFYFNHVPLRLENLRITAPSGAVVPPQAVSTGKFRSTFDVQLVETGTYRLAILNQAILASYKQNGEAKRWRGSAQDFAAHAPQGVQDLQVAEMLARIETFVTAGQPTKDGLTPSGKGLEAVPITHPNDLFVGEPARFRFLVDGKPAPGLEVTIIADGIRYRDRPGEVQLATDENGEISIEWPQPGFYWINATAQDALTQVKAARERRLSYTATVEVLSQ